MLELEVVPEHGLISDVVEFILGETILFEIDHIILYIFFGFHFYLKLKIWFYLAVNRRTKTRHFFVPIKAIVGSDLKLIFLLSSFLGMHFSQAVATIQSLVGSVKGVQILYSDKVRNMIN